MVREARIAALLAQAKEAEKEAQRTKDATARERWLKIAEGYRELARTT